MKGKSNVVFHTCPSSASVVTNGCPPESLEIALLPGGPAEHKKSIAKYCKSKRGHFIWFIVVLILFTALICVILLWRRSVSNIYSWPLLWGSEGYANYEVCLSPECTVAAATLLNSLKEDVNPCDNFHEFVCGGFDIRHEIAEGDYSVGTLGKLGDQLTRYLRALLEEPVLSDDTSSAKIAKIFYQSCVDDAAREAQGLRPFYETMDAAGLWPVLDKNMTVENFVWEEQAVRLLRRGVPGGFVGLSVGVDLKNTSQRILQVDEIGLFLPQDDYAAGFNSTNVRIYLDYLINTAIILGADPETAYGDMVEVVKLEMDISQILTPMDKNVEMADMYHILSVGEIKRRYNEIRWDVLLSVFPSTVDIVDSDRVLVPNLNFPSQISGILKRYSDRTLLNYMNRIAVIGILRFLPDVYQEPLKRYNEAVFGTTSAPPKWKQCTTTTLGTLPDIVSSLYVKDQFQENAKAEVENLIANLKAALAELIESADWMDEKTRETALRKVHVMKQKIGYPNRILNESYLMSNLEQAILRNDSYYHNSLAIIMANINASLQTLREATDPLLWSMAPAAVNAYYSRVENVIAFPAGILQFPMFSPAVPHYFNYGKIGSVIGHEITHGFDNEGRQFDESGSVRNWWHNDTLTRYHNNAKCFVEQFNGITDSETGLKLSGNLTLAENIADAGGLKIAYKAYRKWKSGSASTENKLPGLTNFTDQQLFFISYGNIWCEIIRPQALSLYLLINDHPVGKYRINEPLKNMPEFATAFDCPKGSFMNPVDKCEMW